MDNDHQKEIIAVLEPEEYSDGRYLRGELPGLRELGVWKLTKGVFALVDKVKLPESKWIGHPVISEILLTVHGAEIDLGYPEDKILKCVYQNGKITCAESYSERQ